MDFIRFLCFGVSRFVACDPYMIDAAKSACVKAAFELQSLHVFEKHSRPQYPLCRCISSKQILILLQEFDKRSKQFPLVIILKIHLTLSLDDVWILLEEN